MISAYAVYVRTASLIVKSLVAVGCQCAERTLEKETRFTVRLLSDFDPEPSS